MSVEETFSGNYVVVFDPLDGSSNIDAGIATGAPHHFSCIASSSGIHIGYVLDASSFVTHDSMGSTHQCRVPRQEDVSLPRHP